MAVPNSIADLSVTPASNSPAGSEARSSADDYLRTLSAFVRQSLTSGSDIASATTITPDATHNSYNVTGTTTITTIATTNGYAGRLVWITFTGALILTHNASTMILPGGANITTAANDHAIFRQIGANAQECVAYTKASGLAIVVASADLPYSMDAKNSANRSTAGVFTTYTEVIDEAGAFNPTTGVYTVPVTRKYLIMAVFRLLSGGSPPESAGFDYHVNGAAQTNSITAQTSTVTNSQTVTLIRRVNLTATNTIELSLENITSGSAAGQVMLFSIVPVY